MFKAIPDFPKYEINEDGEIYSLYFNKRREVKQRPPKWNPISRSWGYVTVTINTNKKVYYRYVHRLVFQSFIGPCPAGMEARHLDGNRLNNKLSNLAWGSPKQNSGIDKVVTGTSNRGIKNGGNRLRMEEIDLIIKLINNNVELSKIATIFKVSYQHIYNIKRGQKWAWYTKGKMNGSLKKPKNMR